MKAKVLKKLLVSNIPEFMEKAGQASFEPRGISNFEGLCLWSMVKFYQPKFIVESGVSRGRSTLILCEAAKAFGAEKVFAYDKSNLYEQYVREKLLAYSNLVYEIGDGAEKIASLSDKFDNEKVGIFIDGPKVGQAYAEVMAAISKIKNVQFIVSHDCSIGSPTRLAFETGYKKHFVSKYSLFFTDPSFCEDKSFNDPLRKQMQSISPEKISNLDGNYCYVGVIS